MATLATKSQRRRKREPAAGPDDPNLAAAALLYDMAALQPNERSRFGYKRAARAIVGLPLGVGDLIAAGTLRDVPFVGPASARVITEFIESGRSPTVEAAIGESGKGAQVAALGALRAHYLSQDAMQRVHGLPLPPGIVSRGAFRGDFQMHSSWSDGGESIETMAEACMRLGHTCMGVTDHSYGLPVARGISMESAARQHREIDRLNERHSGQFRIFRGIEANILADGRLDLQPEERAAFEFVLAAPHSLLRRSEDQTERMLAAVRSPSVAILGHPRGRMFNSRPGVTADWRRVFDAAAERRVAIEIDGNWHRQDIDFALAREAADAGCMFALDSDAHSIGELRFTDFAIAHARLAGIPADRVINCWADEKLEAWMAQRMSS
jgi:histidinol phosphatase-like PHP family hydrolase